MGKRTIIDALRVFTTVLRESLANYIWLVVLLLGILGGGALMAFFSFNDLWLYASYYISTIGLILLIGVLFILIKVFFK